MIKDMTAGSPFRILWNFSMPMLLSMAFQQFYNIVDSMVAGKFGGSDALAAVGASYPITMIFIAIAAGANIGASVIVSQLFGAKQLGKMKTAIWTAMISTISLALLLTVAGSFFCNMMMRLMQTPENIFTASSSYLAIYIFGLLFLFVYNIVTGIFTALGDSKTPLYFLIFSSLFNIFLDILFAATIFSDQVVAGVAWATFIAQGISSVLAFIWLMRKIRKIHCEESHQYFELAMLKRIAIVAVPSIVQQSCISVGQLFVQGKINTYGSEVVAGYAAAVKLNTFFVMTLTTVGNALSNFTAQNIGAEKHDRVPQGFRAAMKIGLVTCGLFMAIYLIFAEQMIGLFLDATATAKVMEVGVSFIRTVSAFYLVIALKLVTDGVLRGAGAMKAFMVDTFSDLILRVAFSFVLPIWMGYAGVWWAYPIGWVVGSAISLYCYYTGKWKRAML